MITGTRTSNFELWCGKKKKKTQYSDFVDISSCLTLQAINHFPQMCCICTYVHLYFVAEK